MEKLDPNEVIGRLMDAAPNGEAFVIETAAINAGFFWRCLASGKQMPLCNEVNNIDDEVCAHCKAPRPPELYHIPEVVHVAWYGDVTLCGKPLGNVKWRKREEADKTNCEVCLCRVDVYLKTSL